MSDEREIESVRRQAQRQRPKAQVEATAERLELLRDARDLLSDADQGAIEAFMRGLGVKEGSPTWKTALRVWRSNRRDDR